MDRSENMRKIKSKDTSIEIKLRKELWKRGYRYRKNCKDVFGKQDICFKKKKIAIFCDSEFRHGKYYKEKKYIPKTNTEFGIDKFERNIKRDMEVNKKLKEEGWTTLRFWEYEIKKDINSILNKINNQFKQIENK